MTVSRFGASYPALSAIRPVTVFPQKVNVQQALASSAGPSTKRLISRTEVAKSYISELGKQTSPLRVYRLTIRLFVCLYQLDDREFSSLHHDLTSQKMVDSAFLRNRKVVMSSSTADVKYLITHLLFQGRVSEAHAIARFRLKGDTRDKFISAVSCALYGQKMYLEGAEAFAELSTVEMKMDAVSRIAQILVQLKKFSFIDQLLEKLPEKDRSSIYLTLYRQASAAGHLEKAASFSQKNVGEEPFVDSYGIVDFLKNGCDCLSMCCNGISAIAASIFKQH